MSIKTGLSIAQYFSKILGRPVGRGESATKVQQEALKKLNKSGAMKQTETDPRILKPVKTDPTILEPVKTDPRILKPVKGKKKSKKASRGKRPKSIFLTGGQAEIDADGNGVINARDFKILREKNKKKKGGVTSAIKKIRGIGMAKGGFKKKTPIY